MERTPDEIKKGLECCSEDGCKSCPYEQDCYTTDGFSALAADALALIQQLQDDNAQQARCIENMTDKLNAMNDEVAKLQAERDAAVSDINIARPCRICKNNTGAYICSHCDIPGREFEWRGAQKEE